MEKGTVVVTGAAGGMGQAVCRLLCERGYRVWKLDITDRNDTDYIRTDITSEQSVLSAADHIRSVSGKVDAVVNMAGIYDMNSLVEMSEEEFLRIFNINFFGMYRINKAFLPLLNPNSRIVMVSSELAPLDPLPFTGIYGLTKSALEKYACSLRMELQLLGHKVIVLRPGAVDTGLLPESVACLDRFCASTELYRIQAERFRRIVDRAETRSISPEKLAALAQRALKARHPRLTYGINRNPWLRLLSALPQRTQLWIIRRILRP